MKAILGVLFMGVLACAASAGIVSLIPDTITPDPNEEVTVWVHTDEPLFCMGLAAYVTGDATITTAMSEADCNEFGWDNGWNSDPYIDPNGWVYLGSVRWAADANDIVGYFKFIYHSGQVSVYIDQENSTAFGWDGVSITYATFSTETFLLGEPDPNAMLIEENPPADPNENTLEMSPVETDPNTNLQPVVLTAVNAAETESLQEVPASDNVLLFGEIELPPLQEPNEPTAVFMQSPASSSGLPRGEEGSFVGWSQQGTMLEMLDSEPNVIEINSDITTNQIWDANNVYYITDVNGIDVQALLVIEPGTTVIFGYQCGMFVNNGGTLIAKGTPDKPIIFTPDWVFFDYPDYVGYYWQVYDSYGPYYHSIYIEDTASPLTTVRYCMIEGAVGGIVTDNIRLTNPIENNYLFGNIYGIYELGPKLTDIRNNLCFYNDEAGIEAYLEPDPNDISDTENLFTIEQNTCDSYQYCGITVHGVVDANEVPTVYLLNNIVSSAYWYGLNLVDGYMQMVVVNTGYYDNGQNKNWEFGEYNPVVAQSNPYYPYIGEKPYWHHHLAEGSDFIDAGSQYIEQTELIGTTTNFDGLPDKDIVDLGFHHTDWDFVGGEGIAGTDIDDLITLSNYWLTYTPYDPNSPNYQDPNIVDPNTISYGGDWNNDGFVDLADFAILAGMWQAAPDEPNIVPIISDSISDGWIRVGVNGFKPQTQSVFVFVNGKYVGKIFDFDTGGTLDVDVSESGLQSQQLKLITLDWDGHITCQSPVNFTISSGLNYCILPQFYDPNEPLNFMVSNNEPNDTTIEVYADGGQLVWSQTFSGNNVCGSIPATITGNHEIECVYFDSGSEMSIAKSTHERTSPLSVDPNVKALIVLPSTLISWLDFRTIWAVEDAFKNKSVKYIKLTGTDASYANIAKYAPQIHYLYLDAHGHWSFEGEGTGVLRTNIDLADGTCVSAKASDFVGTPPIWCRDPLPGHLEQTTHSFAAMGFTDLRLFYNDGCLGAHLTIGPHTGTLVEGRSGQQGLLDDIPHNDMSLACGMTSSSQSRFYQGWFNGSESFVPLPLPKPIHIGPWGVGETSFQKFSRLEWEALGGTRNLYEALGEAISGQNQFGDEDAVNNYRIKGQDFLTDVRVQSN